MFIDDQLNTSLTAFEGDLKYWASTLEEYKDQFHLPSVGLYLHELSLEMDEHLDNIAQSLAAFAEIGVPTIRFVQKHGATNILNLSTVATFFSAVTATSEHVWISISLIDAKLSLSLALQFSFANATSRLEEAVNTFWFLSLVFSIASAVNSLLGLTWKAAI